MKILQTNEPFSFELAHVIRFWRDIEAEYWIRDCNLLHFKINCMLVTSLKRMRLDICWTCLLNWNWWSGKIVLSWNLPFQVVHEIQHWRFDSFSWRKFLTGNRVEWFWTKITYFEWHFSYKLTAIGWFGTLTDYCWFSYKFYGRLG